MIEFMYKPLVRFPYIRFSGLCHSALSIIIDAYFLFIAQTNVVFERLVKGLLYSLVVAALSHVLAC